jgi:folate-binding protein YgfZ
MIPAASAALYDGTRGKAAVLDRSHRGRIFVKGADRASYLQGLLTNDIAALSPGRGCYAAYLTAQGRMISDMWVYEIGDVMLVTVEGDVKDTVLAKFDQFIFGEDVQLGDVSDTIAQIAIVGPDAARTIAQVVRVSESQLQALPEDGNLRVQSPAPVIVTRIDDVGVPGFELYVERFDADRVLASLRALGVPTLDQSIADTLRIEAGMPRFHRDMDEDTIPLEAGIESRAISRTKGCYVGQEVIIRVLDRGHGRVARRLVGIAFDGAVVPSKGDVIRSGDREIGTITSATYSFALQRAIALGYVHRDFVEPGTKVYVGSEAGPVGTVTALPFVAAAR